MATLGHNQTLMLGFLLSLSFVTLLALKTLAEHDVYIVHMDPAAMPKAFSTHHHWYVSTLQGIGPAAPGKLSLRSKLIYTYNQVLNGFSASLSPSELDSLKLSPGFVSAIKDLQVRPDTTHSPEFLGLKPDSGAWPASQYGKGIIVGLVDTGIWPESESFDDSGMEAVPSRWKGECEVGTQFNASLCNKKLIGARYFNKGLRAHLPSNVTISMNSARDTDGHGSHTSSTAAGGRVDGASYFGYAPGSARGVAFGAHVAMYKALWDEGTYNSDVVAAIDRAVDDGVNVLSLSLGISNVSMYEDPVAVATFGALRKGVFVSTSSGNAGPSFGTLHNGTPWVLTVAAATLDREFGATIDLANGVSLVGKSLYHGDYSYPDELLQLIFLGLCKNLTEMKTFGERIIVVCEDRNGRTLDEQMDNVAKARVAGGIFITHLTELERYMKSSFPAIFLRPRNGKLIKDFIKEISDPKEAKVRLEFRRTFLGTKPAPQVASYSSRGPSPSCPYISKPDIMAPGDSILAAWPDNTSVAIINSRHLFSKFNLLSGTSMACPHAAGVAALIMAVHPDWSSAAIRSAMMTTSDPMDNTGSPISDTGDKNSPANPLAMGSGHINPSNALHPGLIYNTTVEDYINLLCALNYTEKQMKTITGSSSRCSNPSLDLNYPSFIALFSPNETKNSNKTVIKEFRRSLTNVEDGAATYVARLSPTKGFSVTVEPKRLVFERKYETKSFTVRLEGPKAMEETAAAFGYLSWEDTDGRYVVRSPVVLTNLISNNLA